MHSEPLEQLLSIPVKLHQAPLPALFIVFAPRSIQGLLSEAKLPLFAIMLIVRFDFRSRPTSTDVTLLCTHA